MSDPTDTKQATATASRRLRRTLIGAVTRDRQNKTRRVEVISLIKDRKYGKFLKRTTVCHVHDETNESGIGDEVEIMETRPLSKTKRWRLVRIIRRAPKQVAGDVAVGEPAVAEPASTEA
jgi:small subunit ribosomal protein S17